MHTRTKIFGLSLALLLVAGSGTALADVPSIIGFQGYLLDDLAKPVDAPAGLPMSVAIYHEASGGNPFWTDNYGAVPINNGVFFELLGAGNNPVPTLELDGGIKYLEIAIAGGEALQPRLQIISVPYAMRADIAGTAIFSEEAGKLGGLSADDFAKASEVVGLGPSVQELKNKVAYLEGQIDVLVNQGGANCDNECSPKGSVGCSEDLSQTFECGESGDEDPCFEKLFSVCPGDLKCVSGECVCAPAYEVKCIGDTPYELDSCGNKGKMLTPCDEGMCSNGGCVNWLRETPPKSSGINDMIAIGGDLYAVGNDGVVLHYDGQQWTFMASGTTKHLNAVWGYNNNNSLLLYAVGENGKIIRYQGGKWSTVITGSYTTLNAVFGLGPGDVIAVGDGGKMLRTVNGTWKSVTVADNVTTNLHAVWAASSSKVWVGGESGQIFHLDAAEWAQQPTQEGTGTVRDIWGSNEISIWAATDGSILKIDSGNWNATLDNGVNFRSLFSQKTGEVLFIYAVGDGGNVYKGADSNWSKQTKVEDAVGTGVNFRGVSGGSDAPMGDIWVIATDGTVAHEDIEASWLFPSVDRTIEGIWGLPGDPNSQWAVGQLCLALQYQNGEWLESKIQGTQCDGGNGSVNFNAIWGEASGEFIFAVGNDGMFKFWDGDGWADHEGPNGNSHQDLWGIDENNMLVVQKGATFLWNGVVWQNTGGGGGVSGYGSGTDNFYVVDGTSGKVNRFDGSEWKKQSVTTSALIDIWGTGANDVWAVGNNAAVFKFNGNSWVDQSVPEELLATGSGTKLNAVWMSVLSPVYIAAGEGHTYILDGGMWTHEQTTPTSSHNAVFGISSSNIILGGESTIYRRDL